MDTTGRAGDTRAGVLGIVLTGVAAALTLALGRAGVQAWPGWGTVPVEEALLPLVLTAAALLTAWVALVLGRATVLLAGGRGSEGPSASASVASASAVSGLVASGAGWDDPTTAGAGLPRSVRVACLLLVTMAGVGAVPAHAAVPVYASPQAAPPLAVPSLAVPALGIPSPVTSPRVAPSLVAPSLVASAGGQAPAPAMSTTPAAPGDDASGRRDDLPVPQPGWTPTPRTAPRATSGEVGLVATSPRETTPETVVVRRGDTLWDLAARHLGPGSTSDDVAQEWPRWYAANRDTIGPDPDLILPGQELIVPTEEVDR